MNATPFEYRQDQAKYRPAELQPKVPGDIKLICIFFKNLIFKIDSISFHSYIQFKNWAQAFGHWWYEKGGQNNGQRYFGRIDITIFTNLLSWIGFLFVFNWTGRLISMNLILYNLNFNKNKWLGGIKSGAHSTVSENIPL